MALTMRAVMSELDRLDGQPIDRRAREEIVHAVARAALMGARGNSGVILSGMLGAYAAVIDNGTNDPAYYAANLAAKK